MDMSPELIKAAVEFAANPCFETHRDFCYHMNLHWGSSKIDAMNGARLLAARCMVNDRFREVFEEDLKAARIYAEF